MGSLLQQNPIVEVRDVSSRFGEKLVFENISLDVKRGEVLAIVGASGSGKSTLLRQIVMLQNPTSGSVKVLGREVTSLSEKEKLELRRCIGVLFQGGALFASLTVLENVGAPLREHTSLSQKLIDEIALLKISLVGLAPRDGKLYPSELSGGMRKRVAMARALALDPELLCLDEPSSGLDPITADALDGLVLQLKESLNLTVIMVTHDMDSLWRVADRVALIGEARLLGLDTPFGLYQSPDPSIKAFFQGPRGRAAMKQAWNQK